jgi:hypothetical protein
MEFRHYQLSSINYPLFPFTYYLLSAVWVTHGHEIWIQPDKFLYKRTETINLKFATGSNFEATNWVNDGRVNNLSLYFEDASDSTLRENLGETGDSLQLAMIDEGTVMLAMHTSNAFEDVEAGEFNRYIADHDMKEAIESRIRNGDTLKNGRENYEESVKTILQVGDRYTNVSKKRTHLPLDIVPTDHPYNIAKDGNFKVQVFFRGEKLKQTRVNVWHRLDDKISHAEYTTNEDGEIKFFLSPEGEWMVSCVKMVRSENRAADWQSYWGSLTWGYY